MKATRLLNVLAAANTLLWLVAARAADSDGDGVDDSLDVCCETPAGAAVDEFGQPLADVDGDCDVDLQDFATFQLGLTGPREQGCCFDSECDDGDPCTLDACDSAEGVCTFDPAVGCGDCTIDEACPELVCDVPLVGTIANAAETDTVCFCITEGEILRVSVIEQAGSGAGFNPSWRLLDAAGNPAADCGAFATAVFDDCGPLPAAGSPYQLVVEDGSRNDIGSYKATMQRLRFALACDDEELACDVPLPLSISDTADEDLAHFTVEECDMVRISVVEAVGSLGSFGPSWRLIDGGGNPDRVCGGFATTVDRDCGPLYRSGNPYRVEIEDGGRNEVGDCTVNLQHLTAARSCEGDTLDCGTAAQGTIDSIGDSDLFSFRVIEGEIVRLSLAEAPSQPAGFNPSWRLVDGNGFPAVSCGTFATTVTGVDCGPLPASGNPYRVEVQDGTRNDTGTFLVRLDRLPFHRACDQVALTCGSASLGAISTLVDLDLLSFSVPEGETVRVAVFEQAGSGQNFAPSWRLLNASGRPSPVCGAFSSATSVDCGPLPAALNPYRLEVEDGGRNDVGSYTATVTFLTTGCP